MLVFELGNEAHHFWWNCSIVDFELSCLASGSGLEYKVFQDGAVVTVERLFLVIVVNLLIGRGPVLARRGDG